MSHKISTDAFIVAQSAADWRDVQLLCCKKSYTIQSNIKLNYEEIEKKLYEEEVINVIP